jgi:hypothetical protein
MDIGCSTFSASFGAASGMLTRWASWGKKPRAKHEERIQPCSR